VKKAFTLVELLISIAIVSLVGLAVYSVFAGGVNAWRRGNISNSFGRNIRLSSEKITRDLRNTFKFSNIAFEGTDNSVKFPALILAETDPAKEGEENYYYEVGRVAYFYDQEKEALCKEEKRYPEVFKQEEITEGEILIPRVSQLEFSYCYLDNATGSYEWKSDWKKEEQDTIPQAVKIKLVFKEETGQKDFERTMFIPAGTGEQKIELGSITETTETEEE
jgi:prepilin-type N-terminal cleavage/methylation domain-containing protein